MATWKSTEDRFWSKVVCDLSTGCWLWTAYRQAKGYGVSYYKRANWLAHRMAWRITNGPIPGVLQVLHRCDNPPCVNPQHLFLGTNLDNRRDSVSKGRHLVNFVRGERNSNAKLTDDLVRFIRNSSQASRDLAQQLGVSWHTVRHARARRTWRHVL